MGMHHGRDVRPLLVKGKVHPYLRRWNASGFDRVTIQRQRDDM
jgi:hypothetical protein